MPPELTCERIPEARLTMRRVSKDLDAVIGSRPITHTEHVVPTDTQDGVSVTVLRRADSTGPRPAIVHLHGGGMVMGDRFVGAYEFCAWVEELDVVVVTVEYRLAPEHPHPAPVEDCLAALRWTLDEAGALGVDREKVVMAGTSAGGGLAAGALLLLRDRGGPRIAGQLLCAPMLDDRGETVSAAQYAVGGVWDRVSNRTGWAALLGDTAADRYAAPARAVDLADLPPAYVDVGGAETFRDEDVAYASALWRAGVPAELHVWPGAFHGSDSFVPGAPLSRQARRARVDWIRRVLRLD
ncbi:alpha/beta hydrolase [Pseudonocardia xishanensis]|uniref:Alpha/beta hydrolase n=2 Tax=Pseudonocardia xishanensis TaxID=630995 RepID=A0ABP8RWB8_9PSEU